jgi:hypothetical protein
MQLASVALARVCHKVRHPQIMGLQSSYCSWDCRCSWTFHISCKKIGGEIDCAYDGSG